MLRQLWHRFFGRPIVWQRSIVPLDNLEALARTGLAGMLLAQEKARLDFLSAREAFARAPNARARALLQARLEDLQAANAVVQALLNEHQLEQRLAEEQPATETAVGKSR